MDWNDIWNYLKAAFRGGWRIIGKIKNAIDTDGLITIIVLIAWLFVQNPERDAIKMAFIWLMNISAGIALAVRWAQVKYKTTRVRTRHKDAKEQVKVFNSMAFTLALLCVIFFIFRHLLKYGPETDAEIVVNVILFVCITMTTAITRMNDRT